MDTMKLFLYLGLKGQSAFVAGVNNTATATSSATRKMADSWGAVDKRMSNVAASLTKMAAFLGGGALLRQAVLDVTNFERGLTEMRLTGELTAKEMETIRKKIIDLSSETLQLPEDQLEAFKRMVADGIDPKQILNGLRAIDRTATAAFASVSDIGKTATDLLQKMDIKPEKLERAFNIMHKAGKSGKFELKNMAQYFPEVLAAASQYGIKNEKGVAQVAAMLQIAARNRGNPAEAATDMKAFFGHIFTYAKDLRKVGFNVYDYIDMKPGKNGIITGQFKAGQDIDTFFEGLKKKTKGGSAAVLKAIGIQDYEASNFMAGLMKDWKDYQKIRDEALGAADQNVVGKDFDEVKKTSWAKLRSLEIDKSKAMKSVGSSQFAEKSLSLGNWAIENPITAISTLLGGYGTYKLLLQRLGGKDLGSIGKMIGGGMPVTVTNFPAGLGGRIVQPNLDGLTNKHKPLPIGPTTVFGTSVAAVPAIATAVVGGASIRTGEYLADTEARYSSTKRLEELRKQHMVLGGGPNSYQVQAIDRELAIRNLLLSSHSSPSGFGNTTKNEIKVDVHFDELARAFTKVNDMSTNVQTNSFRRGDFFDALTSTSSM